jgi:hypothetical protein
MEKILDTFGKKFIAKLIGIIGVPLIAMLNKKYDLGLTDDQISYLIGLVATYIAGQSVADAISKGATSSVAQAKVG